MRSSSTIDGTSLLAAGLLDEMSCVVGHIGRRSL